MSGSQHSDVVIIGGGIIGLSAAYRLAKEGLRVSVLERGLCGRESSWAGAGVLQCGSWHRKDPLVHLLRESLHRYPDYVGELRERTGIDPQFVKCGSFELLLEDQQYRMAASEVRAAEAYRESYGFGVLEMLTPQEALAQEPNINPDILGVQYCAVTCQVRNPPLMEALRAACLPEKTRIVEHCQVLGLSRTAGRVTGVRTTRGDYPTGHVVLAAGSWSALIDADVGKSAPVYPVRGQIVLLEMRERPFTHIVERGKCYMVPRLDGRIVIGATEEHESGFEKRNTAEGINNLLTLSQRLVPCLAGATLERTWSGLRPGTPDRGPYIGPVPGAEGLIAACGHFRSGLILAPLTAEIMVDLIVRGRTDRDLSRYAPGRQIRKGKMVDDVPAAGEEAQPDASGGG
jgi:glycine oxidase